MIKKENEKDVSIKNNVYFVYMLFFVFFFFFLFWLDP